MFYFISLNLPRLFLRFGVFIKKHACPCIKFRGSTLPQLLVYLILRSFPKIEKFKFASVCVCVCVCVCVYISVCINVTRQNNIIIATCKTQNISCFTLQYVVKFQNFISWKFKKIITYTRRCKILPAWNVVSFPRWLNCCIH